MHKLKLPIIKESLPSPKWLSMDDYLRFVMLNLKYTLNRKVYRRSKRLMGVNAPFSLES